MFSVYLYYFLSIPARFKVKLVRINSQLKMLMFKTFKSQQRVGVVLQTLQQGDAVRLEPTVIQDSDREPVQQRP